jgi:hypothetical protein
MPERLTGDINQTAAGASGVEIQSASTNTTGITISNQGTAASGGSGTALGVVQPTGISNMIIKR